MLILNYIPPCVPLQTQTSTTISPLTRDDHFNSRWFFCVISCLLWVVRFSSLVSHFILTSNNLLHYPLTISLLVFIREWRRSIYTGRFSWYAYVSSSASRFYFCDIKMWFYFYGQWHIANAYFCCLSFCCQYCEFVPNEIPRNKTK